LKRRHRLLYRAGMYPAYAVPYVDSRKSNQSAIMAPGLENMVQFPEVTPFAGLRYGGVYPRFGWLFLVASLGQGEQGTYRSLLAEPRGRYRAVPPCGVGCCPSKRLPDSSGHDSSGRYLFPSTVPERGSWSQPV
jgi:hypothetical protein